MIKLFLNLASPFADLGNERSVETLNQNIRQNFGDVDILVTAAGGVCGQTGKSIFDVSEVDWREVLSANLDLCIFPCKAFYPYDVCQRLGQDCNDKFRCCCQA